ncbi:thioesterase II family protein [Actinoplanes sp. NPDC049599]|uniref:thioesterase II family protein n=1 Tax=Actinoplanes sp. NPDC049599 TaxID=3363903 RepID=UPI00378848EF
MTAAGPAPDGLLCLPFAGAGASFFRPWQDLAPAGLEVVALQLPGREWRLAEEPCATVQETVDVLLPEAAEIARRLRGVALFGHSLGAVIAYELARRLVADARCPVALLVVSGSPAPWHGRSDRATALDDDEFLLRIEEFAGYRHEALADPEMRELILPTLRADVRMHEEYEPGSRDPIDVPVTAVRGSDDELVTAADTAAWRDATRAGFTVEEFDGGHMYLTDRAGPLLSGIAAQLSRRTHEGLAEHAAG